MLHGILIFFEAATGITQRGYAATTVPDVFVARFDTNGNFLEARAAGGPGFDTTVGVVTQLIFVSSGVGLLLLRFAVGVVFLAHGYNHIFGGGKIEGTGRWFNSLGMKPGILHAWVASLTELASSPTSLPAGAAPAGIVVT